MSPRWLLSAAVLLLGGCLAIPHLNQRSPQVSGRVIDATTGAPVVDARVEFVENSSLAGLTYPSGEFMIRATRKPEIFVPIGDTGPLDIGQKIPPRLRVTHDSYAPAEIDASKVENLEWGPGLTQSLDGPLCLRPISLERLAPPSAR